MISFLFDIRLRWTQSKQLDYLLTNEYLSNTAAFRRSNNPSCKSNLDGGLQIKAVTQKFEFDFAVQQFLLTSDLQWNDWFGAIFVYINWPKDQFSLFCCRFASPKVFQMLQPPIASYIIMYNLSQSVLNGCFKIKVLSWTLRVCYPNHSHVWVWL